MSPPAFLAGRARLLQNAQLLVVDTNIPAQSIAWLAENIRLPIFADPVSTAKAEKLRPVLGKLHTLKPNRLEAELLSGVSITDAASLNAAADALLATGLRRVFISLGGDGVFAADHSGRVHVPCCPGEMVNTTGCGDAGMAASAGLSGGHRAGGHRPGRHGRRGHRHGERRDDQPRHERPAAPPEGGLRGGSGDALTFWTAQILGLIGSLLAFTAVQTGSRRKIIGLQLVCCVLWVVQYVLLGAWTGVLINLLGLAGAWCAPTTTGPGPAARLWLALFLACYGAAPPPHLGRPLLPSAGRGHDAHHRRPLDAEHAPDPAAVSPQLSSGVRLQPDRRLLYRRRHRGGRLLLLRAGRVAL